MCAIENKARIARMVEPGRLPISRRMTPITIRGAIAAGNDELSAVNIFVAVFATRAEFLEGGSRRRRCGPIMVAGLARCRQMFANQSELRPAVIEYIILPIIDGMTRLTSISSHKLVHLAFVWIAMTIITLCRGKVELVVVRSRFLCPVTSAAWNRSVRSEKRIVG